MSRFLLHAEGVGMDVDAERLFHDLDLVVRGGEMVEVRGANASGKSTLLRCLAGLIRPGSGTVEVGSQLAYLGHRSGLTGALTARENLRWQLSLCSERSSGEELQVRIEEALARFDIRHAAVRPVESLSAGQRRRVALAGVLASPARLWLLDEPLTALDDAGARLLTGEIQRHLDAGGGVVAATHRALGPRPTQTVQLGAA